MKNEYEHELDDYFEEIDRRKLRIVFEVVLFVIVLGIALFA